jgi:L-asparaginase
VSPDGARSRRALASAVRSLLALALASVFVAVQPLRAAERPLDRGAGALPEVLVLTTGGTIASRDGAPMLDGAALVRAVPELGARARLRVEEVFRVGSSRITPADRLALARRVARAVADGEATGVVVTHGTDTLEETAFLLELTAPRGIPIVMTGAMRGADEPSADGPANLLAAVRVAVHAGARDRGVLVVLDEQVHAARHVRKLHDRRTGAFGSGDAGAVGLVDPDGVRFFAPAAPAGPRFDAAAIEALPRVAILADHPGFDGGLLHPEARGRIDGVVVQTFAGGRGTVGLRTWVRARGDGLPIVVTSRVPLGRVVGDPGYGDEVVLSRSLRAGKARVLLMLALTRTRDRAALQALFDAF